MKKFIMALFFLLNSSLALADAKEVDLSNKSALEMGYYLFEYSKMINENLKDDAIETSFYNNIEHNFNISTREAKALENGIRFSIKSYRWGQNQYNKIKSYIIAPEIKTKKMSEEEFEEIGNKNEYIESDEAVIKKNFLRVIPYSFDPKHFKAVREKYKDDLLKKEPESELDLLRQKITAVDYKSWFDLGQKNDKPIELPKKDGVGQWFVNGDVSARLLSPKTKIGDNDYVVVALDVFINKNKRISYKPDVAFDNDENIEKYELFYQAPKIFVDKKNNFNSVGYFNQFAVVAKIYLKDNKKTLNLISKFDYQVCGDSFCKKETISPKIEIKPGVALNTNYSVFIQNSYNMRLQTNYNDILKKAYLNNNGDLVFDIISNYISGISDVFIVNKKASSPIIKISDNGYEAIFKDVDVKVGESVDAIIKIDALNTGSYKVKVEEAGSLGLICSSLFAGLLIYFYPWMLCLFLMILYKLPKNEALLRKEVLSYGVCVLFAVFLFAVVCMTSSYYGWWLENRYYLFFMIFVLFNIFAYRNQWFDIGFINKKTIFFAILFFMLGLSTQEVLFKGANFWFFAIGMLIPFAIFYYKPGLIKKIPKPSEFLEKISKSVNYYLFFAIIWLGLCFNNFFIFITIGVLLLLGLYYIKTKQYVELNYDDSYRAVFLFKNIIVVLFFVVFVISIFLISPKINKNTFDVAKENSLIKIEPNWCVLCKINNLVLKSKSYEIKESDINLVSLPYNTKAFEYMISFDAYKPPFYVVYSRFNINGLVIPSFIGEQEVFKYIIN